jgi:hypothetical protein
VIQPEIRYFFSPDIDDLEGHEPTDPDNFSFLLRLMIGAQGEEGEEAFDVTVSTPGWLEARFGPSEVVTGENRLLVFRYHWPSIEAFLRKRVSACSGSEWREVACKIARFARWEFADGAT